MSLPISVRTFVPALILLFASPVFAATSTGATLIPGILNEYPAATQVQTTAPTPVAKPVAAPKPVVTTPPVSKPATVSTVARTRTLSRGMSGSDVRAVQNFLIALSFLSSGSATGYFGPLTESAIKKFQEKNNIVSSGSPSTTGYGAVGPRTRSVIASGQSVGNVSAQAVPSAATLPAPVFTPTKPTAPASVTDSLFSLVPSSVTGVVTQTVTQKSCTFNGQTVSSGTGVFAYNVGTVSFGGVCSVELRICDNGQLSGSYQYSACSQNTSTQAIASTPTDASTNTNTNTNSNSSAGTNTGSVAACVWNGSNVDAGQSVTAYQSSSVAYGSQCVSESRTCVNGSLSGSFQYATCSTDAPLSCTFNGQTIVQGGSVAAYQNSSVAAGSTCISQARTCNNGTLSGNYQFASCAALSSATPPPANCAFNGTTVAAGASVPAYPSATVPYGSLCLSEQRTCVSGTLSGTYTFPSCQVSAPSSCTFNGSSVAHGATVTGYQASSVAYGSSCISQTRTCNNGTLLGTYQYASCSVAAAPISCTLNGQTIASGSSVAAFQSAVVGSGGTCVSQTRTCTNGVLSGSSAYAYDRCVVQPSNAPLPNMYIPATMNGVSLRLHAWYSTPSGSGPFPVIILAHGCSGLDPGSSVADWDHQNAWASLFRGWGYATLIVDSFAARGYPNGICANSGVINSIDRAIDMFSAATVLAQTAGVNPQKIGVFGSSHGGNTVETTVRSGKPSIQNAFNGLNAVGGRIAGSASLYPICDPIAGATYYSPLFVAIGADDDWDSPAVCKSLTNYPTVADTPVDLSGYGALLRIIVYKNATHRFDAFGPTSGFTDGSGHTISYNPAAAADVESRIHTFFDSFVR